MEARFCLGPEGPENGKTIRKGKESYAKLSFALFAVFLLASSPYVTFTVEAALPPSISIPYEVAVFIAIAVFVFVLLLLAYTALVLYDYMLKRNRRKAA